MNLAKWFQLIKPNLKLYQGGFFEFPFLANTPELMIESTINTPGSRHIKKDQAVFRNNPFTKGEFFYRKIEEGLWLTITNVKFKHNTVIKSVYDKNIPSNHYTITFTLFESEVKLQNTFIDKAPFQNKFWGFKKPGTDVGACFYKGTKSKFFIYYISPEWIKKNVPLDKLDDSIPFKKFLDSNKGFISYQDIVPNAEGLSYEILHTVKTFNEDVFNETLLKSQAFSLISSFLKNVFRDVRKENYQEKGKADYKKISECERIISTNLSAPFVGIETIAKKLNLSPSKLKTDFKSVYGTSILQYHIQKKMELAMQLILNTDLQIKYIAQEVGYESQSKFSIAFKNKHGKLPSEIRVNSSID
ncbi:helix-turn-helix domain-containing protein [Wenyingzhuangia aestuarii]|uniref:helix-turn-helix domain-containing protein n=1 Tax=Wenyingzhuangia aestuarii TaxID=1647582 RepID=UPI00143B08F2|nr:AraC family transcriptional regulator [Wenyingzhuangia aestuarii]NJB81844.1 AraC-like DNA-binding protein [Wenyingzhuangia aestuarii]